VAPGGDDTDDCLSPATACATIGAAVTKANDDDTIQIAAGTYNESNIFISKRLTLNGADAATTIVDGGQNGRVFTLSSDATLSHLTIQNGRTPENPNIFISGGGGVRVGSGVQRFAATCRHPKQRHFRQHGAWVAASSPPALTIDQSQIISNTAEGGGGIYHYAVGES
jgi:hypothetical protein